MTSAVYTRALCAAFALFVMSASHAFAREVTIKHDALGVVKILAPDTIPSRFVIFISDRDGLTESRLQQAESLVVGGAAVALIDIRDLMARLAARADHDCHYIFGDFEDFSHRAERQLGMLSWRWPVMLGVGEGGTLAYLALAQAPTNTAGGAVSIGFTTSFATKVPFCPGAKAIATSEQGITYEAKAILPGDWTVFLEAEPAPDMLAFIGAAPTARLALVDADASKLFAAASTAALTMQPSNTDELDDLPLTELPGGPNADTLVIFFRRAAIPCARMG